MDFNKHIIKELLNEYGGSEKKKTVVLDDQKKYLLKFPDPAREADLEISYINNAISEYISCSILKSMGFDVQNVILGSYTDEKGKKKIACACEDIRKENEVMHEVDKLELGSLDSIAHKFITFDEMNEFFENFKLISENELKTFYYDLFIADAFIGNTDRHNGNWALLTKDEDIRIAPVYDCGSSLSPLLSDEQLSENTVKIYSLNVNSAICDNDKKRIKYSDCFKTTNDENIIQAGKRIIPRINLDKVNEIIQNTDYISEKRKEFYSQLLNERYEKMVVPFIKRIFTQEYNIQTQKNVGIDYYSLYKQEFKQLKCIDYCKEKVNIQGNEIGCSKAGKNNVFVYDNKNKCIGVLSTRSNNNDIRENIEILKAIGITLDLNIYKQQKTSENIVDKEKTYVFNKWEDKSYVIKAVSQDGLNLENASDELKDDKEVVLAAVRQNPEAIQFASERLYNDSEVCEVAGYEVGDSEIDGQNPSNDNEEVR